MTIYYLSDCIRIAYAWSRDPKRLEVRALESQVKAVDLFVKTIKGEIGLSAVQGPPGTGKTSVFDLGIRRVLEDITGSPEKSLVMYIAPTNHLVIEAFTRFAAMLFARGFTPSSVASIARVYGSKIAPCRRDEGVVRIDKDVITCSELKSMMGNIDTNVVRFIFTTEYQRISQRFNKPPDEIRYVVDEASKTPFYRVFLPIARKIIAQPEEFYPRSMIVLGDPRQAIAVEEAFRIYNIKLLMEHVERMLRDRGLYDKNFAFLDTTFRLPGPTEYPISRGFYEERLRAFESYIQRSSKYRIDQLAGLDILNKAKNTLGSILDLSKTSTQNIIKGIDTALSSRTPLIIYETRAFKRGDTFHSDRARVAYIAGLYLAVITQLISGKPIMDISITAPYSDLVHGTGYYTRKKLAELGMKCDHLRSLTVQAIIGGESDIIISMLGKEWLAQEDLRYTVLDMAETMYYREPEVLNVQLSRHRLLMILVGNIQSMYANARRARSVKLVRYERAGKWISETLNGIEKLVSEGSALRINVRNI